MLSRFAAHVRLRAYRVRAVDEYGREPRLLEYGMAAGGRRARRVARAPHFASNHDGDAQAFFLACRLRDRNSNV